MKHCPNPQCRGLQKFRLVSEYEDHVDICADCGTDLVAGPAPAVPDKDLAPEPGWDPALEEQSAAAAEDGAPPTPDLELVTIHVTNDESELLVLQSLLEAAGIPYLCRGEQIQDLFGMGRLVAQNPITGPVQVQVAVHDREAASKLLEDDDAAQA